MDRHHQIRILVSHISVEHREKYVMMLLKDPDLIKKRFYNMLKRRNSKIRKRVYNVTKWNKIKGKVKVKA